MEPTSEERFIARSWPYQEAKTWIRQNKPKPKLALLISKCFFFKINITSDQYYKTYIRKLNFQASKTTTGYVVMKKLLQFNIPINIKKSNEFSFEPNGKFVCVPTEWNYYDYSLNKRLEYILVKEKMIAGYVHELIHLLHYIENSKRYEKFTQVLCQKEMVNKEELFTITGCLHQTTKIKNFCCENTLRLEMSLPIRVSHLALNGPLSFTTIVDNNIKGTARRAIRACIKAKKNLNHSLAAAIHFKFKNIIPQILNAGAVPTHEMLHSAIQHQLDIQTIDRLIDAGAIFSTDALDTILDKFYDEESYCSLLLERAVETGLPLSSYKTAELAATCKIFQENRDPKIVAILDNLERCKEERL
jgi:hypothetical protein